MPFCIFMFCVIRQQQTFISPHTLTSCYQHCHNQDYYICCDNENIIKFIKTIYNGSICLLKWKIQIIYLFGLFVSISFRSMLLSLRIYYFVSIPVKRRKVIADTYWSCHRAMSNIFLPLQYISNNICPCTSLIQ